MIDDSSVLASVSSVIPAAIKTSTYSSNLPDPRRGGRHPIFGIYMVRDAIDTNYELKSPFSYINTSQICSERSLNISKTTLHTQRAELVSLKFNGKLDVSDRDPSTLSELNM